VATALTETANFDSTVVVPEDGVDDETASSLVPAFQSLANRSRALKAVTDIFTVGGSCTPAGAVTFGGTHYSFTPTTNFTSIVASSTLNVGGNTAMSGSLVVGGGAEVGGSLTVDGSLTTHAITTTGSVAITGGVTVSSGLTAAGLTATVCTIGTALITGDAFVSGIATLHMIKGKRVDKVVVGADANTSYAPASTDVVFIGFSDSPLTGDRTYTIDDTNAVDGMRMTVANYSTAHIIHLNGTLDYPSGFTVANSSGDYTSVDVLRVNGSWRLIPGTISQL
jgi:hypothetical protein